MLVNVDSEWLSNISRSSTFEIRLWGWKATWHQISEQWLLGYGVRAPFVVDWSDTPYAQTGMMFLHPHNLFLSIWYDAGLVGLILLLILLALIVKKLYSLQCIQEPRYWSYIFLFVLLASLVDSPTLINRPAGDWLWFWLPLAIAINAEKILPSTPPVLAGHPQVQ